MKTKTEPKTETAKHTPGPWIMEDFGEVRMKGLSGFRALEGSKGEPITRLVRDNSPEGLANAALIAAAPELLALLKKAGIALRQYQAVLESQTAPEKMRPGLPYSSRFPYGIDVEKEISQAIAQAEGRKG